MQKPEEAREEEELVGIITELLDAEANLDRVKSARHAEMLKELLPLFCAYTVVDFSQFTKCPYCRQNITACSCFKHKKEIMEINNPFVKE